MCVCVQAANDVGEKGRLVESCFCANRLMYSESGLFQWSEMAVGQTLLSCALYVPIMLPTLQLIKF